MNKEQKQELINEIVGILHKDACIMYDADFGGEQLLSLTEDYFEDVAESIFQIVRTKVIQTKKNALETEVQRLNLKLEHYSEVIERYDRLKEKYDSLMENIKTPCKDPNE